MELANSCEGTPERSFRETRVVNWSFVYARNTDIFWRPNTSKLFNQLLELMKDPLF